MNLLRKQHFFAVFLLLGVFFQAVLPKAGNSYDPIVTIKKNSKREALRRAFIKTFGSPSQVATKATAIVGGALGGTIMGGACGVGLIRLICDKPNIIFSDAVPRSEQIISYCLMTFSECVGCVAGGLVGNKMEEFLRNFVTELETAQ